MVELMNLIKSGDVFSILPIVVGLCLIGYILVFKQNWIRAVNVFREKARLRYKIKTGEKTNQIESKIIKIVGWTIIILGIFIFLATIINVFCC